jgi:hypothetical protein
MCYKCLTDNQARHDPSERNIIFLVLFFVGLLHLLLFGDLLRKTLVTLRYKVVPLVICRGNYPAAIMQTWRILSRALRRFSDDNKIGDSAGDDVHIVIVAMQRR